MKVNDSSAVGIGSLGKPQETTSATRSGRSSGQRGDRNDHVTLSSLSSALQAQATDSPQRTGRISQLASAVAGGSYRVDSHAVSGKIIQESLAYLRKETVSGHPLETARRINSLLDRIREELLDPDVDVLAHCDEDFDQALADMEHLSATTMPGADLRPEYEALLGDEYKILRRNLSQISALVRNAGAFYEALSRMAREADSAVDYAGVGRSASNTAGGQVLLHG
jgi:flagellar biosynthesis anti-sigma factor FlgM